MERCFVRGLYFGYFSNSIAPLLSSKFVVYVLDLPIGIYILMNLQTHQQASAHACAYMHGDYTNCPQIREVWDTEY